MTDSADTNTRSRVAATDSPWFWLMIFSAAGLVVLGVAWPKYVQRQARLELKYRASREVTKRRVEGETAARPLGQEGDESPPPAGELLVPLWPIAVMLVLVSAASAGMFWRWWRAVRRVDQAPPAEEIP